MEENEFNVQVKNEEDLIKMIDNNFDKIDSNTILKLIQKFEIQDKYKYILKYKDKFNIDDILTILINDFEFKILKEEDLVNISIELLKDVNKIDSYSLLNILNSVDDMNKLKLMEQLGYLFNKEDIMESIEKLDIIPDKKIDVLVKYKLFDNVKHNKLIGELPIKLRKEYLQKIILANENYNINEKDVSSILDDMEFEDQINILELLYSSNILDYNDMLNFKLNVGNLKDDQISNLILNNDNIVMKFIMATYIKEDLVKLDIYKELYALDHFKFINIALNSFESEKTKFKFVLVILNYQDNLEYTIELLDRINLDNSFYETFINENKEMGKYNITKEAIMISKFDDKLKIKYFNELGLENDSNYCKLLLQSLKFNDKSLDYSVFKEVAKESFNNKQFDVLENINENILKNYFNDTEVYYLKERKQLKNSDKKLLDKYVAFSDLSKDKISFVLNVIGKVNNSNCKEVINLGDELKPLLFETENPLEKIDTIEKMLIKNNLPQGIKIYEIFEVLHPDFETLKGNIYSKSLNNNEATLDVKNRILLEDAVRISFLSSPKQGLDYLNEVEDQMFLLRKLLTLKQQNVKYEQLDEESKAIVDNILNIVNSWSFIFKFQQETDLSVVYNYLNEDMISGIEDWIVDIIAHSLGKDFKYLTEVKDYIINNSKIINKKHKDAKDFKLQKGDLIKKIGNDETILYKIFQNGVNCKEFLGVSGEENTTNLDVDFKIIKQEKTIENTISTGNLWIVIKNNEEKFNTNGDLKDTRMELFELNEDTYGIRSGVPTTEIDYIICKDWNEKIGFAMASSEIYIPVVDIKGNLLFSYEEYEKIRLTLEEYKQENIGENEEYVFINSKTI